MWFIEILEFFSKHLAEALFTGALSLMAYFLKSLAKSVRCKIDTEVAIQHGIQSILRDRIIQLHVYCMLKEPPHMTLSDSENLENLYNSYIALGGNGTIKKIKKELDDLDIKID